MTFGKERRETPRGRPEGIGRETSDRGDYARPPGGADSDVPKDSRQAESTPGSVRLKNSFEKAGKRLESFYMSDNPTQPQELYWLTRNVEKLIDIVEGLAIEIEGIKRERAAEAAVARDRELATQEKRKWITWGQKAVLGVAIGTVGWILREIVSPILAHLRK